MSEPGRVYINGRFLCRQATGVQNYASGLIQALQNNNSEAVVLAPHGSFNIENLKIRKTGIGSGVFWEQLWLPLFLLFRRRSLLLNFSNTAPLLVKNQFITVHDLAFRKDVRWFSPAFRAWYNFLMPRLCRKVPLVITVSGFIKKEICSAYHIPEEKIMVLPNGLPQISASGEPPFDFRYLMITGVYNPRKNASFIVSLLPLLKKHGYHVVGTGHNATVYGRVSFTADPNLHILGYVDKAYYYSLMKHSEALIFPSEYEGFGIPVLEALCMGRPVIMPDMPEYRESFGDLPCYYSAGNSESFFQAIEKSKTYKNTSHALNDLRNKYNFDKIALKLTAQIMHHQNKTGK